MATTTRTRNAAKPAAKTTTAKPAAPKAAAKPATKPAAEKVSGADAPVPAGIQAINENLERAAKGKATNAAAVASGETRKCEGKCGQTKPITKFPTTSKNKDGEMGRAKVCRACRDEARKAAKGGK